MARTKLSTRASDEQTLFEATTKRKLALQKRKQAPAPASPAKKAKHAAPAKQAEPEVMSRFHYLQQDWQKGFHTIEQLVTLLNHLEVERFHGREETVRKVYALIGRKTELTPALKLEICHLLAPVIPVWFGDEEVFDGWEWVDGFAFHAINCLQQFYVTKDPTYQGKEDTIPPPKHLFYYRYVKMCRLLWVAVHLQDCTKPCAVFASEPPAQAMCRFLDKNSSLATFGKDEEGNYTHVKRWDKKKIFNVFENELEVVRNVKGGEKLLRKCKPKRSKAAKAKAAKKAKHAPAKEAVPAKHAAPAKQAKHPHCSICSTGDKPVKATHSIIERGVDYFVGDKRDDGIFKAVCKKCFKDKDVRSFLAYFFGEGPFPWKGGCSQVQLTMIFRSLTFKDCTVLFHQMVRRDLFRESPALGLCFRLVEALSQRMEHIGKAMATPEWRKEHANFLRDLLHIAETPTREPCRPMCQPSANMIGKSPWKEDGYNAPCGCWEKQRRAQAPPTCVHTSMEPENCCGFGFDSRLRWYFCPSLRKIMEDFKTTQRTAFEVDPNDSECGEDWKAEQIALERCQQEHGVGCKKC